MSCNLILLVSIVIGVLLVVALIVDIVVLIMLSQPPDCSDLLENEYGGDEHLADLKAKNPLSKNFSHDCID